MTTTEWRCFHITLDRADVVGMAKIVGCTPKPLYPDTGDAARAALESALSAADPVAFRWRGIGEWFYGPKKPDGVNAQPLYPTPPAPSVAVKAGPLAHALASELERMGEQRPNGDILHDALSRVLPALSAQVQSAPSVAVKAKLIADLREMAASITYAQEPSRVMSEAAAALSAQVQDGSAEPIPQNKETLDQAAAVMLMYGTPSQQAEAIAYASSSRVQDVAGWKLVPKEPLPIQLETAAFNLSAEYGPEFVLANQAFARDVYNELVTAAPTIQPVDAGPTVTQFADRLFGLHGLMLSEMYQGKHAVTITFPDLAEAQQFHGALVELSKRKTPAAKLEEA